MGSFNLRSKTVLSFWRLPLALGLLVAVFDQVTKVAVVRTWPIGSQSVIIPGLFNLVHFRNPGAAWGMFGEHTELLAVLSGVVLIGLVARFEHLVEGIPERALALGAVSGGIVGNMVDRILHGMVTDFLLFHWHGHAWPAFNVADSAISCGVGVFVISCFFRKRTTTEHDEGTREPLPDERASIRQESHAD